MDREQMQERLGLLRRAFDEQLGRRGQVAQQLAQLDRGLEQRRGGIELLELLIEQEDESDNAQK